MLLLVMVLIDYLLCEDERNVEPTYSFGYIVSNKENMGSMGMLQKYC